VHIYKENYIDLSYLKKQVELWTCNIPHGYES